MKEEAVSNSFKQLDFIMGDIHEYYIRIFQVFLSCFRLAEFCLMLSEEPWPSIYCSSLLLDQIPIQSVLVWAYSIEFIPEWVTLRGFSKIHPDLPFLEMTN